MVFHMEIQIVAVLVADWGTSGLSPACNPLSSVLCPLSRSLPLSVVTTHKHRFILYTYSCTSLLYHLPFIDRTCAVCGVQLSSHRALKEHMTIHTNTRLNKCDLCSATFRQISVLYKHKLACHPENAGRFQCELCGKAFNIKSYLQSHMTSHTGN